MFELIDFDERFASYSEEWMQKNRGRFKNIDAMEDAMHEVYMRWLNAPADFLGGEAPAMYFKKYDDPQALFTWLCEYELNNIPAPDLLLERIADLGEASAPVLIRALADEDCPHVARITAANLLKEVDAGCAPMDVCLGIIDRRGEKDALADVAAELVSDMGAACVPRILERFDDVCDDAQETYIDILCNFPGDARITSRALEAFETHTDKRALYASYIAKLGDDSCLPALKRALDDTTINYLDYLEIKHAIEALGGEAVCEREFAGDPYYEVLKSMDELTDDRKA